MKVYGSVRHDVARCTYGCCGGKLTYRGSGDERAARKRARKRARREGKKSTADA